MIALPPGWQLVHRACVDSTNARAIALANDGAAHGTIVIADEQRAGRGRHGRGWDSPPGNLYASVVLRPSAPVAQWPEIGFVAGLALAEAVTSVAPGLDTDIRLKWPNDLLLRGQKLAGLLLESTGQGALVVGSGVNLASAPGDPARPATALAAHGIAATPWEVLEVYATGLEAGLDRWAAGGFAAIRPLWLDRAGGLGQPIRVRLPQRELSGTFADLDPHGALVLALPDGSRRTITAGDVFPLAGEAA
jgi:BirA family biotin operon repressor/biotin-[acetyl-CoA-carboxylase] ligase